MVAAPYWREWYHSQHEVLAATCTGDAFESYAARVLGAFHDDFINPQPDLLPLIDVLNDVTTPDENAAAIREVPPTKMDFNALSDARRLEMNAGRRMAPRIGSWYGTQSDPDLSDKHGARFKRIYQDHSALHADSDEIMEALYESLAGAGFRRDSKVANSVYAVTSYFFDLCHIFETPPEEAGAIDAIAEKA